MNSIISMCSLFISITKPFWNELSSWSKGFYFHPGPFIVSVEVPCLIYWFAYIEPSLRSWDWDPFIVLSSIWYAAAFHFLSFICKKCASLQFGVMSLQVFFFILYNQDITDLMNSFKHFKPFNILQQFTAHWY